MPGTIRRISLFRAAMSTPRTNAKTVDAVIQAILYEAAEIPRQTTLGPGLIVEKDLYDLRKRPLAIRYERAADGAILAEVRYAYDAANNQVARQFIHRNGRADFFQYDAGNRLTRADLGVRPDMASAVPRSIPGFATPRDVNG